MKTAKNQTNIQRVLHSIPSLSQYAYSLTGNAGQAELLVQMCLQNALSGSFIRRRLENIQKPLFSLMYKLLTDQSHLDGKRIRSISMVHSCGSPVRAQLQETVEALALNTEQRAVLHLIYVEDICEEDVAEILNIPITGVRVVQYQAKEILLAIAASGDTKESSATPILRLID